MKMQREVNAMNESDKMKRGIAANALNTLESSQGSQKKDWSICLCCFRFEAKWEHDSDNRFVKDVQVAETA
jgi:hypothetical protein